jgi:trimeric autotransporter adhesin
VSVSRHSAKDEKAFTAIQAGGIAAIIGMLAVFASSVFQGGTANAPRVAARATALIASTRTVASGTLGETPAVVAAAPWAPSASNSPRVSTTSPSVITATPTSSALAALSSSDVISAGTGGASVLAGSATSQARSAQPSSVAPAATAPARALSGEKAPSSAFASHLTRLAASPTDPTMSAAVDPAVAGGTGSSAATVSQAGGSAPAAPFTTSPAGVTASTFNGILPAGQGGYDVTAQADPAFAQVVVNETNAAIAHDLATQSNAFGIGGYVFPAGSPFGPSNPLFTGQSYGPTWYAGSGTPEPPPSQWAIDPITGLPHDPATGGSVTPGQWATNPWNPESPNYQPDLYTASGQTPPN